MSSAITINTNQKKTGDEIELSITALSSLIPRSVIEQTFPCYSGYQVPIDYLKMRPKDFIGPLEHEILPDSPIRKAIWLAHLHFNKEEARAFLLTIPGIDIIKKIDSPEYIFLGDTKSAAEKNCFDEAFEDNNIYQQASKSIETYGRVRSLAFEQRSPRLLLNKFGYKEVAKASKGDLIVYFSNAIASHHSDFPVYSSERKISHYGRIVDIASDGTLIVKSRFNHSHVFHHRIDCIPYFFGNSYLIFTNTRFSEESDFKTSVVP